jgi:hypothetical protein
LNALQAGFLAVDDVDTIRHIQSGNVSISGLFFSSGSAYYRPLAILSLLMDFRLFGGNPAGYHLTNIVLHLANSLLVYYLATLLLGKDKRTGTYPLLVALLFALHPVNSEAVVWISARPDLLCCFFFLLCLILLIKKSSATTPFVFTGLFLSFFCSLASKEASLFLPFIAIIYCVMERNFISLRNAITTCGALFCAGIAYLLLRKGLPIAPHATADVIMPGESSLFSLILDWPAAYGFYFGKLLYPFPLNIAITDISMIFCLVAFLLGGLTSAFLWKRDAAFRFPAAILFLSLIPPLGAFTLSTAWTPYAERYLYIPSVAFSLCIILIIRRYFGELPRIFPIVGIVLLALPTAHRVTLWKNPISFWQDAVTKSPHFGTLRLPLAAEYLEVGRLANAEAALHEANKLGLPRKSARDFYRELQILLEKKKATSRQSRKADMQ